MGSDRARRSYDPSRMFRSVVFQQGRVTADADFNESEEIRAHESRAELLDIIGPAGAPDDGFKIAVPGKGLPRLDFTIGKGTLYLGGVRVHQDADSATYFGQQKTEWVGGAPLPANKIPFTEAVYLAVSEQEVCAVEDEALREVALGGPDTAARTRLIQRVQRLPVSDSDCEKAFAAVLKVFAAGASFDSATMRLDSTMRLRVDFVPEPATADACQPTAQSGFLGADNQLIRVQVSDTETMLWGWDNASFLYRVLLSPNRKILNLQGIPVGVQHHHPTLNQWVELLGTTVNLGGEARMAGPVGITLQVEAYDPDDRTVTLKTAVPENFLKTHSLPLFLRVWENRITFAPNEKTPVQLVTSKGISTGVRIYTSGTAPVAGDYWTIGVRPSTPQSILPARLARFQPPDGPKRWVAPLAVVAWRKDLSADVTDCRRPFVHLVKLTGGKAAAKCCELLVSPEAHQSKTLTLQDAIDTVVKAGGGTICLEAGVYKLEQTLVVNGAMSFRITGKGPDSRLQSDGAVALDVSDSAFVTLDAFRVECTGGKGGHAIVVGHSRQVHIERLRIDGDRGSGWAAGIALSGALEDIAIRENWILADEGIVDLDPKIATGLADLRVEDNLLECAKVGVRFANMSVHQGVSRFVGNSLRNCNVAGFKLQGMTVPGCAVEVIGNTLEVTGDGIITGLDGMRIADNDLTPGLDKFGKIGIFVTGGAADRIDDAQITGNRITRFGVAIMANVPIGSVSIARNQISTSGTGLEIKSGSIVNLTIDGNQIAAIGKPAVFITTENGRITVSDNHLQVTGGKPGDPIVTVSCRIGTGDCLFCQNHCAALNTNFKIPTVFLTGRTLVLASNRMEGGVALTCATSTVTKGPLCTVLGNVSGMITINGKPLADPLTKMWEPLNVPNI